jgi:molybdopterin-guanine dinucleotide biosynthesis protein A
MGKPKWNLPFGGETMFERIARRLSEAVDLLIVVGPAEGSMPRLQIAGRTVLLARDRVGDRGPLEGLAVGLATAAEQQIDSIYATACDTPLLRPEFVRFMFERAKGFDAAVVRTSDGDHPLPAVYAVRLADQLEAALAAGERRAGALAALGSTRWITSDELATCDPELLSVRNLNTPEDYSAALAQLQLAESRGKL